MSMSQSPEDLLRSFELQATEHAERARELGERIEQISAAVQSAGGEVRVTVDSTGGLSSLTFGSPARGIALDQLAELVMQSSRQAQARLAASIGELVSQIYGPGSETANFVSRTYAERFPTPEANEDGKSR
jgi:DNA-binding protein YbaB